MKKNLIVTCILGILTIMLGAFGAHALKNNLAPEALKSFETAVRYQMYHVIVLLIINMYSGFTVKQKNIISYFFFAGILFFSGSIYAIQLLNIAPKKIWFVTPLGGLLFIFGWIFMLISFIKKSK